MLVGGEIFHTCANWPWGPTRLLYKGYFVSFPGIKQPGHCIDHPTSSNTKVKQRVEIYLYASGPSWPVPGLTFTVDFICSK
jgi:hypothetical protein